MKSTRIGYYTQTDVQAFAVNHKSFPTPTNHETATITTNSAARSVLSTPRTETRVLKMMLTQRVPHDPSCVARELQMKKRKEKEESRQAEDKQIKAYFKQRTEEVSIPLNFSGA